MVAGRNVWAGGAGSSLPARQPYSGAKPGLAFIENILAVLYPFTYLFLAFCWKMQGVFTRYAAAAIKGTCTFVALDK